MRYLAAALSCPDHDSPATTIYDDSRLVPGSLHSVMVLPLRVIRPSEAEKDSHKSCDEHRPPHTYRAARATASLPGGPPSRGRASQSQPSTPNRGGGGQGKGMISPALQASKRADEGAVVRPVPTTGQPAGTFFSRNTSATTSTFFLSQQQISISHQPDPQAGGLIGCCPCFFFNF